MRAPRWAVSWLRRLFAFSLWRPGFDPWPAYVGIIVNKLALGQVLVVLWFFPVSIFHRCSILVHLLLALYIFVAIQCVVIQHA
jgi:hypothetical protein